MEHEIKDTTFVTWVIEREKIRKLREAGVPRERWTNDIIMKNSRFCNVSREDDRMTKWIKKFIRDPFNEYAEDKDLFLAVALARFMNTDLSLGHLIEKGILKAGQPINLFHVSEAVSDLQYEGKKVFNSAYMVGAPDNYRSRPYGRGKIAYVCGVLADAALPKTRGTRQAFVENLSSQFGFAEFMAGQIAADLAYTRLLVNATDHLTWSPRGPGAIRGMNRALGRPLTAALPRSTFIEVGQKQMKMLPADIVHDRKLTLHDVASNMNCEVDKMLRGGGHRKYRPGDELKYKPI